MDTAKRNHNCQGNAHHRIGRGDTRLKVHNGRNWDHYCLECAKDIARRDIAKLEDLAGKLNNTLRT